VPGRVRRVSIATLVAVCVGAATVPTAANAGPVEDLLGGIEQSVNDTMNSVNGLLNGGGGGGGASKPAPAPAPLAEGGTTDPGITGTNPHAQGEVLDVTTDAPVLDTVVGTVVIGQSRGEQDENGDYHGNVTIASVSGLGIDLSFPTDEGETETSPLDPVNQGILDSLCSATDICLGLLEFTSDTDDNGSHNSFSVANADVLEGIVEAGILESEGNIDDDGSCQTASASSTVADVGVADQLTADAMNSSSDSTACNDGTETANGDSQVLNLAGVDVLSTLAGCDEGVVDDEFSLDLVLLSLVEGVCNGDDTNGSQASAPYNVRKAIGLEALPDLGDLLGFGLLAVDASTSESHAQAPGDDGPECPDPSNPDCPPVDECPDPGNPDCPDDPGGPDDGCPDPSNPDCPDITVSAGGPGGPGGPDGPSADTPDDTLAFTGADIGILGAIGVAVMVIGLALMAATDRRRGNAASA